MEKYLTGTTERIDALRTEFGNPSERSAKKIVDYMTEEVMEFIGNSPFAVLASSNSNGDCDASPRGGKPGFVSVLDTKHILLPDISGNRLFQSYTNIESNPKAGLIFFIPGYSKMARVNGRVKVLEKEDIIQLYKELEVNNPDANTHLIQGLMFTVDEAYTHCPRALNFSKLWDTGQIEDNRKNGNSK